MQQGAFHQRTQAIGEVVIVIAKKRKLPALDERFL